MESRNIERNWERNYLFKYYILNSKIVCILLHIRMYGIYKTACFIIKIIIRLFVDNIRVRFIDYNYKMQNRNRR